MTATLTPKPKTQKPSAPVVSQVGLSTNKLHREAIEFYLSASLRSYYLDVERILTPKSDRTASQLLSELSSGYKKLFSNAGVKRVENTAGGEEILASSITFLPQKQQLERLKQLSLALIAHRQRTTKVKYFIAREALQTLRAQRPGSPLVKQANPIFAKATDVAQKLAAINYPLAKGLAKKSRVPGSIQDKATVGALGLIAAVERFLPELGFRFTTYATKWINQHIFRELGTSVSGKHVPEFLFKDLKAAKGMLKHLEMPALDPTDSRQIQAFSELVGGAGLEVAARRLATVADARRKIHFSNEVLKVHAPVDVAQTPLGHAHAKEIQVLVREALSTLEQFDREILVRKFGFDGEAQSNSQIAEVLGVNREAIARRERKVLAALRKKMPVS